MNDYTRKLQEAYVTRRVHGAPLTIYASGIEGDKRSRARVIRELVANGSICVDETQKHDSDDHRDQRYLIRPPVWHSIEATEPDLVAIREAGVWAHDADGVPWSRLTVGQKKWILAHPGDGYTGTWRSGSKAQPCERIGDAAAPIGWSWDLWVMSPALRAWQTDGARTKRLADLFRQNLPWALKHVAAIDEEDAKSWGIRGDDGEHGGPFFGHHLSRSLGPDPAKWPQEAHEILVDAQKIAERAIADLASVVRVLGAVAQVGGWPEIEKQLRDAIAKHVDEEAAAPPKAV